MDLQEQQQLAAERYRRTAGERKEVKRRQRAEGSSVVDTDSQVVARAGHLMSHGELGPDVLARALPDGEALSRTVVLERILGIASELQSVNFLARGERTARSVGRVSIVQAGGITGFGTGFLVGERLLLTNNHVLPDTATADGSFVEFDFELGVDGTPKQVVRHDLDPRTLFVTDEHLDFSLVAVAPGADGTPAGRRFGWNQLLAHQGKVVIGEPVNVVGHPDRRRKEIAIRDNALLNQLPDFLHYKADTEGGSSGSAVFNDQWEVVALHHAGVPETVDGETRWVANEGTRVSVLLRHLAGLALPAAQRTVLDELGAAAMPVEAGAPIAGALASPGGRREASGRPGAPGRASGPVRVVFLHGRGLAGRDPVAERGDWTGGLARGLTRAGLPPLDAADVWFPFYGDVLADALAGSGRERAAEGATALGRELTVAEAAAPADRTSRDTYAELVREGARRAGMPDPELDARQESGFLGGVIAALQGPLSFIADRSGLDDIVIATVFRDVAGYLERDDVRDAVLGAVERGLPPDGPILLVAHSLGTVVALDLLTRRPDLDVTLMLTAGSPLGMDAVIKRLLAGGPVRPRGIDEWVNAWSAPDAVAIGCPLSDTWQGVRDVRTENPKDRPHAVVEYLADQRVAETIGRHAH